MSSILKALKKLEHEKSGRFPDSLKIDSDILKTTDSSRSFSPFVLAMTLLLVFGGGAAVAFFFMREAGTPQGTTKSQPVVTAKSILLSVPPPAIKPEVLPEEIVVVPARKEPSGKASRKKEQQKQKVSGKTAYRTDKKPARADVSGISEKPKESAGTVSREPVTVPVLRVNGIAFQNSSADSMAIVNGTPVSNGSLIEGALVEDVRKDRVLFQRNGEKFEILLGQSN